MFCSDAIVTLKLERLYLENVMEISASQSVLLKGVVFRGWLFLENLFLCWFAAYFLLMYVPQTSMDGFDDFLIKYVVPLLIAILWDCWHYPMGRITIQLGIQHDDGYAHAKLLFTLCAMLIAPWFFVAHEPLAVIVSCVFALKAYRAK
jgi:hypothetical protein